MNNLADDIEAYLVSKLDETRGASIVFRRGELAEAFSCAPSQISYVLQTRFVPQRGYWVESRRGGGGYIRLTRLARSADLLWQECLRHAALALTQEEAHHLIDVLYQAALVSEREARLMSIAVDRAILRLELPWRDQVRAELVRSMLAILMIEKEA
ncbi:MAG: CtsR family transcriptional regulator [Firmicutes bacterium]|nr:CtsR family transcriptional regulator [Dethiobacter sp.]MBS3889155.1 CtsR family transcriptional regulator [Bacillota bacterium]